MQRHFGGQQCSIRKYDFGFAIYEVLGFSAPGGRGNWSSQARSGCFHFSPFTRARSARFHGVVVAEFPNGRFVGRFCFIGNDIRMGASALAYAHPGRRTISMLRMDDIQPLRG